MRRFDGTKMTEAEVNRALEEARARKPHPMPIVRGERKVWPPADGATGYGISSHGCWMPGIYEDERTAWYAFEFGDEVLADLQDLVNAKEPDVEKRLITYAMLEAARSSKSGGEPR